MTAVDVFVDTVRCYDGACGAVVAPEPWFVGLLVVCLVVLWQAARATTAVVSTRPMTAAGTQLLGRRYGTALTAFLFAGWLLVAFGLSVPALGAVRSSYSWTAMVPLHATLLLSVPVLTVGYAVFASSALRRPGRFRPASFRVRAALAAASVALPAGWQLARSRAPHLVADPTVPGGPAGALDDGLLSSWIGGLWWLADRLASPAGLAVVAAAAACYLLLPRAEDTGTAEATPRRQAAAVVSSASFRRGGGARAAQTTRTAAPPVAATAAGGGPDGLAGTAATASTLTLGAVLAVAGGASAAATLALALGTVPEHGPAVVVAVLAGYAALGLTVRAR